MDNLTKDKLNKVLTHLKSTQEDEWCVGIVRTKDQKKNCIFGHIFNMGKNDKEGNDWWEWFEYSIATTFMAYPINDGTNDNYKQKTPRKRCIAFIEDIISGKEKTVEQMMLDDDF